MDVIHARIKLILISKMCSWTTPRPDERKNEWVDIFHVCSMTKSIKIRHFVETECATPVITYMVGR